MITALIIVNNKGRCSRCCNSERKFMPKDNYPLLDNESDRGTNWFFCHKYGKYCKGIASHCKAPQEGYHDITKEKD